MLHCPPLIGGDTAVRHAISITGICAALVMCAVSAAMNYLFLSSLGKTPLEAHVLGAASAAADILKALLPFLIAWSWRDHRYVAAILGSLAFAFFAGFSLLSAIGFAADNRGALVDARDGVAQEYARMQRSLAETETARSRLPPHRPATIIAEEIERHRQSRRWSATIACTNVTQPESRDFCAEYFRMRAELAAANEGARLTALTATLHTESAKLRESGAGQDSDPQVSLLSWITGVSAERIRLGLIVAVALLVEIGASLGLFLATGHRLVTVKARVETAEPTVPEAAFHDSVEDFCLEALVPSEASVLAVDELERSYRDWCRREGGSPLCPQTFSAVFAELAAAVGLPRTQGGWRGIALKHDSAALDMVS